MIDIARVRRETGATGSGVYLNSARQSPYPRCTLDAMRMAMEREFARGWQPTEEEAAIAAARGELAGLINASPDEIATTQSATHALNAVIGGLGWRPGDN